MRAWFSIRMGVFAIVLAFVYTPVVWFATYLGLPLVWSLGLIIVFLGGQYYLGVRRAFQDVDAERLTELNEGPQTHPVTQMTEELAAQLDVPMPTIWISDMGSPNAFAVGRQGNGHVVIDVTLLDILEYEELQAVIAHELSHLKSRDSIPMVLGSGAATIAHAALALLESLIQTNRTRASIARPLAHTVMMVFVFAISREREYIADSDAKRVLGSGDPLADALEKLEHLYNEGYSVDPPDSVDALCITSHWSLPALGATHPDTTNRINRLRENYRE